MRNTLDTLLSTVVFLLLAFILFFIGKLVFQLFNRKINVKSELVEKDNLAFAVAHTGYFAGLVLALGGALQGESHGFITDLINVLIYGLLAILLLNISNFINQKILLRKFNAEQEIVRDQNVGVGVIEAANSIANGLIIMGALTGEGGGVDVAVAFWLIGQVLIILTAFVYTKMTPYDDYKVIEQDNVAAGIGFAGAIIAIGNIIRFALAHDFESWTDTFSSVAIDVAIGLLFLPLARILSDRILLTGSRLTHEIVGQDKPNVGAGLIEAFAYIGGSVLICWCLA